MNLKEEEKYKIRQVTIKPNINKCIIVINNIAQKFRWKMEIAFDTLTKEQEIKANWKILEWTKLSKNAQCPKLNDRT